MGSIRVAWFLNVDAEDGETIVDYARYAASVQDGQISDGYTGVFEVIDENGTAFEVDLESDEENPPSVVELPKPTAWGAQVVMSEQSVDQALVGLTLTDKEKGLLTLLLGIYGGAIQQVLGVMFGMKPEEINLQRKTRDDPDGKAGYPEVQEFNAMGKQVRMTLEFIGGELSLKEDDDDARTAG